MSKAMTGPKSDPQIQQEILQELKWDTRVKESEIGVIVRRGVVTLTGVVTNYAKKVAAEEAAHRIFGVLDVANEIDVKATNGIERTDTEIAQAVRIALKWDAWVDDSRIQTTISDGWVKLEGSVDSLSERDDVERAILRLTGVRGITNKVIVSTPAIDAGNVREMIQGALERRALHSSKHIKVDVRNGIVTLEGPTASWAEKRAVLGAVGHAPGVKAVNDSLYIEHIL